MKKYFIAAVFILSAPQSLLAQAEAGAYYVILDNTTHACRVVLTNDLPPTTLFGEGLRYKKLGQYLSLEAANLALDSMIGKQCPSRG
jgi:hypothetical protein